MIWGASPWADRPWAAAPAVVGGNVTVALTGSAAASAAGTLTPNVTIALAGSQATSAAGTVTYSSGADLTVALSGQSATSATGTLVNSASIALAGTLASSSAGTLTASGGAEVVVTTQTPAGRPARKRTRNYVVEIDGEDHIVGSVAEARALLDTVQEEAAQVAAVAVERAAKATKKPIRKVLHDARKALQVPQITAPKALAPITEQALTGVQSLYDSTMRDIEIAALFRRAQAQEDDDEDVLMLMAL